MLCAPICALCFLSSSRRPTACSVCCTPFILLVVLTLYLLGVLLFGLSLQAGGFTMIDTNGGTAMWGGQSGASGWFTEVKFTPATNENENIVIRTYSAAAPLPEPINKINLKFDLNTHNHNKNKKFTYETHHLPVGSSLQCSFSSISGAHLYFFTSLEALASWKNYKDDGRVPYRKVYSGSGKLREFVYAVDQEGDFTVGFYTPGLEDIDGSCEINRVDYDFEQAKKSGAIELSTCVLNNDEKSCGVEFDDEDEDDDWWTSDDDNNSGKFIYLESPLFSSEEAATTISWKAKVNWNWVAEVYALPAILIFLFLSVILNIFVWGVRILCTLICGLLECVCGLLCCCWCCGGCCRGGTRRKKKSNPRRRNSSLTPIPENVNENEKENLLPSASAPPVAYAVKY
ncbi:hypothetical protein ScalyP_jg6865 [Parmales sp. scaly parma]|nr:hypothetical protein ScalyP_jg6865 [Parmales sp. scaly parma]